MQATRGQELQEQHEVPQQLLPQPQPPCPAPPRSERGPEPRWSPPRRPSRPWLPAWRTAGSFAAAPRPLNGCKSATRFQTSAASKPEARPWDMSISMAARGGVSGETRDNYRASGLTSTRTTSRRRGQGLRREPAAVLSTPEPAEAVVTPALPPWAILLRSPQDPRRNFVHFP